jgi:hypothetical protein
MFLFTTASHCQSSPALSAIREVGTDSRDRADAGRADAGSRVEGSDATATVAE